MLVNRNEVKGLPFRDPSVVYKYSAKFCSPGAVDMRLPRMKIGVLQKCAQPLDIGKQAFSMLLAQRLTSMPHGHNCILVHCNYRVDGTNATGFLVVRARKCASAILPAVYKLFKFQHLKNIVMYHACKIPLKKFAKMVPSFFCFVYCLH